jgi:TP901 family phage tail tape measure protein
MAAADNMELTDATSIMASTMTVFAKQGATAAQVADTLAAGAGVAQGGIHELGEALKYVGSSAASSGMGLQETTGLLATLANNGVQGSMAGTGLAGVLRNLKTPTAAAKKALEEIGLETYNASGEFKGMTPLIEELGSKLDGMSSKDRDAVLSKIFDTRSLAAAIPLLNDAAVATENGSNKLRDMQDAVGQTGYAAEQAARQTDNLAGDWKTFTSSMEQAFISSTQASDNMVRSLVQGATSIVKGYDALPGAAKNAVTLITAGLGAAALGGAGLIKLTEFSGKLITSLETLGVSAQRAGALVRGAGIMMGAVGAGLAVGLAIYASYADSVQRAEDRTQALAATFDVVDGKAQATAKTIQQLMDTMSTKQADFEIFGDKGLAGAFSQLNEQASKLDLKGFGLDVAGAAKAISGSKKDYDAYIASIDALADSQVKTQRANAQTKDSWDALHPSVATYQQQQDSLAATLGTAGQQTEQVKRRLESMREEYEAGALVAEQMKASTNSLGSEYTSLAQAQADASQTIDPLALGTSDVAEQMDSAAQAVDAYVQSLYGLRDVQSGLMSDQSAFEAAIDSVAKAFDSVGTSQLAGADIMDLNTEATRNANDQLRTIADSARNYGAALMESGGSQESARAQMELAAASIMAQGEAWGL